MTCLPRQTVELFEAVHRCPEPRSEGVQQCCSFHCLCRHEVRKPRWQDVGNQTDGDQHFPRCISESCELVDVFWLSRVKLGREAVREYPLNDHFLDTIQGLCNAPPAF